jgi:hypothetical protein
VVLAVVMAAGSWAAGCSSGTPSGPTPADAARSVVGGFGLDSSELGCLEDAFADEPTAREALAVGGDAAPEARDRLRRVLESCITPEELGAALATATVQAIPGTGPTAEECLRTTIAGYDEEVRGLLLVGFVLSGDGTATDLDVELGTRTNQLLATCGVTLNVPGTTDPTGTTIDQTGSAVSTP